MSDIFDTRFDEQDIELEDNRIALGDDVNITEKDPTLRNILIGVGWDLNAFDSDAVDVDVSAFLVDKNGQTRVDEDFVFYNNMEGAEGAIRHNGDSRTGAGDGDDETISIDLQGLPFDVMRVLFVLSVYRGPEKDQNLGMIKGGFIRLANEETGHELLRYEIDKDLEGRMETAMYAASLNREGPKWHFTPLSEFIEGGLGPLAKQHGLTIIDQ